MRLIPITLKAANEFVKRHHRHHGPVTGWKFGVGLEESGELIGVAIAGRPVSRMTQTSELRSIEITRVCTLGHKNSPSMLYGAIVRAAFSLGYNRVISFILCTETGHSLKAAGWKCVGMAGGGKWSRPSRGRNDDHPLQKKMKWEVRVPGDKGDKT